MYMVPLKLYVFTVVLALHVDCIINPCIALDVTVTEKSRCLSASCRGPICFILNGFLSAYSDKYRGDDLRQCFKYI